MVVLASASTLASKQLCGSRQAILVFNLAENTPSPTRFSLDPSLYILIPVSLSSSPLTHSFLEGNGGLATKFKFNFIVFRKFVIQGRNGTVILSILECPLIHSHDRKDLFSLRADFAACCLHSKTVGSSEVHFFGNFMLYNNQRIY